MSGTTTPTPTPLSLLNQTALVQGMAAAVQASNPALLDFTPGSVILALLEGSASVALWLQWLIVLDLARTRLATSTGQDCDTFGADFGFTRLPGVAATGAVTFARFVPSSAALVPVGAQVKTADGTQTFAVTIDSTNSLWVPASNGYLIPANTLSGTIPVAALVTGTAANVQPGTITLLGSAISGIDTVSNALAFTNGVDPESDAAFRTRFVAFINTRSLATVAAVEYAISSVQQGLDYAINESGGAFQAVIDDGTGHPSAALISNVANAIEAVRPVGITYSVVGPSVVSATISLTITAAPGYQKTALQGPVATAIEAYVNGLDVAAPLAFFRIPALAYGVAGVATVESVLLNSGVADIGGGASQVVRTSSVAVN
jgi:uncharacterized phage protein gp47/JayE